MTGHAQPEFHYADLVFELVPERSLYWPEVQRGSILRGAFGSILKEIACDPLCASPSHCAFAAGCAYEKLFAPLTPVGAEQLSLNQDLPRPFVIAPDDFLGDTVRPSQKFSFTVRLFGDRIELYPYVQLVFAQLLHRGFGRDRVKCFAQMRGKPEKSAITLGLEMADPNAGSDIHVVFRTPTYLKEKGTEVRKGADAFPALIKRARDRISSLYHFYALPGSQLKWDFVQIGRLAEEVRCTQDRTYWIDRCRRSTRTGQIHPLSGMAGDALYHGVPQPLLKILRIAEIVNVGKHAAFGLGRISVDSKV